MDSSIGFKEEYRLVVGRKVAGYYIGYGITHNLGTPGSVDFDYKSVYKYEDDHTWDVIGFWHSHPFGAGSSPSTTDYATMDGWVNSLGRPLLCAISHDGITRGWWFDEKDEMGRCLVNLDKNMKPLFFKKIGNLFVGKLPNV